MAAIDIWRKRVAEWRNSGQSAARFCELKSFSAGSLYGWSRRLGPDCAEQSTAIRIARVERVIDGSSETGPDITIELAGAKVRIPAGADADSVAVVLRALREGAQR
jgi:hypothetical protein